MNDIDVTIGQRIKDRRQQCELSLRELAKKADLTAAFLSQVERGQVNTSIGSLRRIAEALDVSILQFLAEAEEVAKPKHSPVVRATQRWKLSLPDDKLAYEVLTPDLSHQVEVIMGRIAPGTSNVARPLRQPTEEWIYVLSGTLRVGLDTEEYVLQPGDTIIFEGSQLRLLGCASVSEDAVWISVITPPVF
jgi:transcriptional regulator with XRE-family HTH domain